MDTQNSQLDQTKEALEKNFLPGGRKRKDDIVQQIQNMYMRKRTSKKEQKGLIPTKAALFGLDVRFRAVDQAALEDQMRRNAFKKGTKRDSSAPSRHSLPMRVNYLKSQAKRDPALVELQSYATFKHAERQDGLPIVKFERRAEVQKTDKVGKVSDEQQNLNSGMPQLNSIKRINRHQQGKQDGSVSGVDSPRAVTQEKSRPMSQPSSQQYEQMTAGALAKHASVASAQPDIALPCKWVRSVKEAMFTQPDEKLVVYQVNTNNCYDNMVESNLNTGLPKGVSFITDKQLKGKKKQNKLDEQELPYEEREFNQKFKETWAIQKQIAQSFRETQDEDAGDARKKMFGLLRDNEIDAERRHPGFILGAKVFLTQHDNEQIEKLEKEAKEMAKNFTNVENQHDDEGSVILNQSQKRQSKFVGSENVSNASQKRSELGPLEKKTMRNLCDRAYKDYALMQGFTGERLDYASVQAIQQPREKEHAAIRVAKSYKTNDFYKLAKNQLSKDPHQSMLLDQQIKGKKAAFNKRKNYGLSSQGTQRSFKIAQGSKQLQKAQTEMINLQNREKRSGRAESESQSHARYATVSNNDIASPKGSRMQTDQHGGFDSSFYHMGNKAIKENKLSLQYNERNLVKLIEMPNQLTGGEKDILAGLVRQKLKTYQEDANRDFDSTKNFSIMIARNCNDERNQIMRRFKFQQKRRNKLHEFSRKERDRIIKDRNEQQKEADDSASFGRPSTAATTNQASQDAAPNLKPMTEEQRKRQITNEFMDFMGSYVTKTSTKTLPGVVNKAKAEAERRALLNQIKHGEDVEDFEPDVIDIADYVQNQLHIGWKTVGKPM